MKRLDWSNLSKFSPKIPIPKGDSHPPKKQMEVTPPITNILAYLPKKKERIPWQNTQHYNPKLIRLQPFMVTYSEYNFCFNIKSLLSNISIFCLLRELLATLVEFLSFLNFPVSRKFLIFQYFLVFYNYKATEH